MILLAVRGSVGLGACPVLTLLGKRSGLAFGFFILRKRKGGQGADSLSSSTRLLAPRGQGFLFIEVSLELRTMPST